MLFDGAVNESCEVQRRSVDVFLSLADVQLGHQLVKNLDAVLIFVGHLGCFWLCFCRWHFVGRRKEGEISVCGR